MDTSFSSVQTASAKKVTFSYDDFLLEENDYEIFKTGYYANGDPYYHALLKPGAAYACYATSETIRAEDPESLIHRTEEDYDRLLSYTGFNGVGGVINGLLDKNMHLRGMAAIEVMDDESDHGSGPVVYHNGKKRNHSLIYWKSLCLLKEYRGKDKGHIDEFYDNRMGATCAIKRPFAVLKIQSKNKKLIEKYTVEKDDWFDVANTPQSGLSLVYETEEAKNDKDVVVLAMDCAKSEAKYKANSAGILLRNVSIVSPHAHRKAVLH